MDPDWGDAMEPESHHSLLSDCRREREGVQVSSHFNRQFRIFVVWYCLERRWICIINIETFGHTFLHNHLSHISSICHAESGGSFYASVRRSLLSVFYLWLWMQDLYIWNPVSYRISYVRWLSCTQNSRTLIYPSSRLLAAVSCIGSLVVFLQFELLNQWYLPRNY